MKRKINVLIADRQFPITVYTEREEELYRKAGRHINNRLTKYRSHFSEETNETLMTMVAFEAAYELLQEAERNDTVPFKEKLGELTAAMEEVFKGENK